MKTVEIRLEDFENDTYLFLRFTSKCLLAARECIDEIHFIDTPELLYGSIRLTFDVKSQMYLNMIIEEVLNNAKKE